MRKRIVIITSFYKPFVNGVSVRVSKLRNLLRKKGYQIELISPFTEDDTPSSKPTIRNLLQNVFRKRSVLLTKKSNILWAQNDISLLICLITKFINPFHRKKVILTLHGPLENESKQRFMQSKNIRNFLLYLLSFINRRIGYRFVSKFVLVEPEILGYLRKSGITLDNAVVAPNYPDTRYFKFQKRDSSSLVFGFHGTLDKDRVSPILEIANDHKDIIFKFYGKGNAEDKITNSYENVIYGGLIVANNTIPDAISDFSVGLITPLLTKKIKYKGFPMKTFEYLACGIPIVLVDHPHLEDFIAKNKLGIVTTKEDFSESIRTMKNSLDMYQEEVVRFYDRIEKDFSWSYSGRIILSMIDSIF